MPIAPEVAKEKLCLALDVDDARTAIDLTKTLKDSVGLFKIGAQLFTSEGPSVVKAIVDLGGQVFLDLKFHDIPNTAAGAARAVARLGVAMFNVHAAGGKDMVGAAVAAATEEATRLGVKRPLVLAVTVLTSINDAVLKDELLVQVPVKDAVRHLAELAKAAGADGVVASPQEVPLIRSACGSDFLIVTPGVRPQWAAAGDQRRITTPSDAIKMGSDYIVVGRPILDANNPAEAASAIVKEILDAAQ